MIWYYGQSCSEYVLLLFLDALFTGLMVAAVLAFAVRFLKVRGVSFKVEVDSRDQDRGD